MEWADKRRIKYILGILGMAALMVTASYTDLADSIQVVVAHLSFFVMIGCMAFLGIDFTLHKLQWTFIFNGFSPPKILLPLPHAVMLVYEENARQPHGHIIELLRPSELTTKDDLRLVFLAEKLLKNADLYGTRGLSKKPILLPKNDMGTMAHDVKSTTFNDGFVLYDNLMIERAHLKKYLESMQKIV